MLSGASARIGAAALAVAGLWAAVYWVSLPARAPDRQVAATVPAAAPASRAELVRAAPASPALPALRAVVIAGQSAPGGGTFDRFDVNAQPIVAPANAQGAVAFYARLIRAKQAEGIFLAEGAALSKIAAIGDPVPGGGRLSDFSKHPAPALNAAAKVAFSAGVAGGAATDGIFLASGGALTVIALTGADAPGVPNGVLAELDTPVLNDDDQIAFVALVRRGRDTLQVLYLHRGGKLHKLAASGDVVPRVGGVFDGFGVPTINQKGVVAFAATVDHGKILGGIFLAGTRDLTLLAAAGDTGSDGAMLTRFSERLAIDDEDTVAFGAHLNAHGSVAEAVYTASVSGLTRVAAAGDPAPGGGRFAAFGAWPAIGPGGAVSFAAALEAGPGPAGVYTWRGGGTERVALVGETLDDGAALAPLALNPAPSAGAGGGVTFATMQAPEAGRNAIYYHAPQAAQ